MGASGVLIVVDDVAIQGLLAAFFREEGYTVLVASDGKPALEQMRAHPEGLVVLLDLMMPGMDGSDVLHMLVADPSLATRHATILMTAAGRTLPEAVWHLLNHLHGALLRKPFDLDQVLSAVQQAASTLG